MGQKRLQAGNKYKNILIQLLTAFMPKGIQIPKYEYYTFKIKLNL